MIWDLNNLSECVSARMSKPRFSHTLGVLKMAKALSGFCLPEYMDQISAAALLHDITKELSQQEQLRIMERFNVILPYDADECPQVLHSFTAPFIIKEELPIYATDEILSAVKKHTIGSDDMSIFDEIIFISDYAEEGRTYSNCIEVREYMLSSMKSGETESNCRILHKACILAIENTISHLEAKNAFIAPEVYLAKKALEAKII